MNEVLPAPKVLKLRPTEFFLFYVNTVHSLKFQHHSRGAIVC